MRRAWPRRGRPRGRARAERRRRGVHGVAAGAGDPPEGLREGLGGLLSEARLAEDGLLGLARFVDGLGALVALGEEGRAGALEGIVLTPDGLPTAPTDAAGFVYAEGDEPPSRLDVLTEGWELVDRSSWTEWGSVMAADGAFTLEEGRLTVHLRAR